MHDITTVALDSSSLTSVALTRILFEKYWGGGRCFSSLPPNLENMLAAHDAALVIGDPALKVDRSQYRTWDLSEEWTRFTGKPFVFAFWAVREDAAKESHLDLHTIFRQSRDHGLEPANLKQIVQKWTVRLGLPEDNLYRYLTTNIHYYLDEDCLAGLSLFYCYAHECKILPRVPDLHFVNTQPALVSAPV
jgi:chorismate dehydratase